MPQTCSHDLLKCNFLHLLKSQQTCAMVSAELHAPSQDQQLFQNPHSPSPWPHFFLLLHPCGLSPTLKHESACSFPQSMFPLPFISFRPSPTQILSLCLPQPGKDSLHPLGLSHCLQDTFPDLALQAGLNVPTVITCV